MGGGWKRRPHQARSSITLCCAWAWPGGLLFPGTRPACEPVFRLPDEAHRTGGRLEPIERVAAYVSALRNWERDRFAGDANSLRRPKTPAIERSVSFRKSLCEIFAEVFHQGKSRCFPDAPRWIHVDIPFADDMPPG